MHMKRIQLSPLQSRRNGGPGSSSKRRRRRPATSPALRDGVAVHLPRIVPARSSRPCARSMPRDVRA
jgi:hypothetical protein